MGYRYVLDDAVTEQIFSLSSRQREQYIRIFRALADDPHQRGDQSFRDSVLREIQK